MATFRKRGGTWRAEVERLGVRRSATFDSKSAAVAWAGRVEAEIMAGARGEVPNIPLSRLLERYRLEISPGKKGARWEAIRLMALERDRIALVSLRRLDAPHVEDWQRRRLEAIAAASVRRERNLLSAVLNAGVRWRWLARNPFGQGKEAIPRPKDGRARERIATDAELERIMEVASPALRQCIIIAVETGMRASEISSNPQVRGRVAVLTDTKNGTAREVPLSAKAAEAMREPVTLAAGSISTLFALTAKRAGVKGLTFHDLRRSAAVRLSKKLHPLDLAKMLGHRDLKMTLNVYYKSDASSLAKLLD